MVAGSAAEREAVGIIAKAAKQFMRKADATFAKRAAEDGLQGSAKDILKAREKQLVESAGHAGKDAARRVADRATAAEKSITPKLESIEKSMGGKAELAGKEFRLKEADSLERKIATDAADEGISPARAASKINDAVRYTYKLSRDDYVDGTRSIVAKMKDAGFEPVKEAKNFWDKNGYQGVNSVWRDASGQTFEVQFHTLESLEAKEATHGMYDLQRVFPAGDRTSQEIKALQDQVFGHVTRPSGASTIRTMGGG